MKIQKALYAFIAAGVLAAAAQPAQATLILTLNAGNGNSVTITDGGVGDLDGRAGSVAWFGSLGSWIFNFTAGLSGDGTSGPTFLDLVSFNATSRRGGTLTITLTNTNILNPTGPADAVTSVTGATSGVVSFNSLFNNTNIGSFGPFTGGFNGTTSSVVDTTGGFSLTQTAQITHGGAGATAFNIVTTVPEPATLGLFGVGLIGLAFIRRRLPVKQ